MLDDYKISIKKTQSPLSLYNRLRLYKEKKAILTPEICREFLQQTNNPKVINELLELVVSHLEVSPQQYPQYNQILLGCLIDRECREDNLEKIKDIHNRFYNPATSSVADYILMRTLSTYLHQDRSKELNHILHNLPKDDVDVLIKEMSYNEKALSIQKKQQEILKITKQAADGKDVYTTSCKSSKGCEVDSQIDLERFGAIYFANETERINIYVPIPQTSNLSELKNLYTFWVNKVDLTDYVIDLPKCTSYVILWNGKAPKELDLSHLSNLKNFNSTGEDFSNTQVFFPYGKELEEFMLFDIEKFPDEFDLTVFSSIKRFRTNCPFKEQHNCRLPHKVDCLELAQIKQESGIIDFSSIKQVTHFHIEDAKLGKNVEIRFPQYVERITFDHTCESIPKRLNLNIEGLKEIKIDTNVQQCIEEIILPQGFELELSPDSKIKLRYEKPQKKQNKSQENSAKRQKETIIPLQKPSFWSKLFSKIR